MAVNPNIIGIVSDEFTNPNTVTMLNEMTRQLNARGLVTLLLNVDSAESYQRMLQNAASLPLAGLVFLTSLFEDELHTAAKLLPHVAPVPLSQSR
ncbi:hypothetical protein [Pantoea sp. CTOTU50773]|uniref:hypothetical protein n=1 Tax=Pantoea sp. CTOTU50773 TaxID=2953853 RepID=UPI0028B0B220|nr:hypothetical protein [Pantoea sp. CTOTU50773]